MEDPEHPLEEFDQDSVSNLIRAATPLVERIITNQEKILEANQQIGQGQLEIAKEELRFAAIRFNKSFWLVAAVAGFLMLLSAGIIFIQGDSEGGLSLLTHLGAVVAGLLAGAGWQRYQASNQQR